MLDAEIQQIRKNSIRRSMSEKDDTKQQVPQDHQHDKETSVKRKQQHSRWRSMQRVSTVAHIKQANTVKSLVRQVSELSSAVSSMRLAISNIDKHMGAPISRETLPKILDAVLDIRFIKEKKQNQLEIGSAISDMTEQLSSKSENLEASITKFAKQLKDTVIRVKKHMNLWGESQPPIPTVMMKNMVKGVLVMSSTVVERHLDQAMNMLLKPKNMKVENTLRKELHEMMSEMRTHVETSLNVVHTNAELLGRQVTETKLLCDRLTAQDAQNSTPLAKRSRSQSTSASSGASRIKAVSPWSYKKKHVHADERVEGKSTISQSGADVAALKDRVASLETQLLKHEQTQAAMQLEVEKMKNLLQQKHFNLQTQSETPTAV